jgi:hypothetical protein
VLKSLGGRVSSFVAPRPTSDFSSDLNSQSPTNNPVIKYQIIRVLRLFQTLRHLRPRQIAYQLYYRATGKLTERGQVARPRDPAEPLRDQDLLKRKARPQVQGTIKVQGAGTLLPVTFQFLNQEVTFATPSQIDWSYAANGKLWTYNLNYFEFLQGMEVEEGLVLIRSWVAGEAGHKDGWEPYPISLRLVSWIRFFAEAGLAVPTDVNTSVQRQYRALWKKIEYHLGGNHLLENAIALCYTAAYLKDVPGWRKVNELLLTEIKEQYLTDGGHFERSGMYHVILLDRLLTLWHGLQTFSAPAAAPEKNTQLQSSLERQLGWLQAFATPAGRYAHFNDSTDGIAPDVAATLNRAQQLGLNPRVTELKESGYRRWSTDRFDCWIDAAAIGPDYIPGHAHADNLTFVLDLDGSPCIVDPAISTYEKNERRAWERSTAAHNTVTVDGQNSSDVWGGFRVGKRAHTTILEEKPYLLKAGHDGYGVVHQRTWELIENKLTVSDLLPANAEGIARLYFNHNCLLQLNENELLVNDNLRITWSSGTVRIVDYDQATGWNQLQSAQCLEITFSGMLQTDITHLS